jgi:spore coat polysaccharide biosynthesis protein SpsF
VAYTLGFIQARMGSTRLPGKVLMQMNGKSILQRVVERLRAAHFLDGVVVLTTRCEADQAVVEEARRLGAEVFRGPDLDVLARFVQAAEVFHPDVIVRATADNPLADIGSVDRIVQRLGAEDLDYCMENHLPVGAATEAITRPALQRVDRLGLLPHDREHVTIYIKEHLEAFRAVFPDPPQALRRPDLRITVDTEADFMFVESLIHAIPEIGPPIPLECYLGLTESRRQATKSSN